MSRIFCWEYKNKTRTKGTTELEKNKLNRTTYDSVKEIILNYNQRADIRNMRTCISTGKKKKWMPLNMIVMDRYTSEYI